MGILIYDGEQIEFDDRVLAHLQVAIITKLRRDEKFALSWDHGMAAGSGHSTVWMHPAVPVRFRFNGSRSVALNRTWLDALMLSANSTGGLHIVPEPQGSAAADGSS